jgi:hypothetical protein
MTTVEFGDYRYIHYPRFNAETKDFLICTAVDTGKAGFLFNDFPVNGTPGAQSSAQSLGAL